jgi:hypothetical protein
MARPPKSLFNDSVGNENAKPEFNGFGISSKGGVHSVDSIKYSADGTASVESLYKTDDFLDAFDRYKIFSANTFRPFKD